MLQHHNTISAFRLFYCLQLPYTQADRVCERRRSSAFALLLGVSTAGFVSGTVLARLLPVSSTFQVAAIAGTATAIYLRLFLEESNTSVAQDDDQSTKLLCSTSSPDEESHPRLTLSKKTPSFSEMVSLLTSR
jgi:hypothetical protein